VPVKTLPVLRSKNVGCFNPNLGIIWTNPNVGLNIKKKITVESESWNWVKILTQHLGLSIFYPNLGWNNQALFRVYETFLKRKKHFNQRILKKYISWFQQKYEAELICFKINVTWLDLLKLYIVSILLPQIKNLFSF